jgi:ribosomal protein L11 methyltransferase
MDYIELKLKIDKNREIISDILSAELAEIGFESFVENDEGLSAYISKNSYDESLISPIIENIPVNGKIEYKAFLIEGKNWNEEWEKHYFEPIVIGNECVIHSSFHKDVPKAKYDILIDPKMSFGTGHHETTSLVIGELLKTDLAGKSLLDMGCGTCILAILASMRGANPITAIDIDEWCYENSVENLKLNSISNIAVLLGDAVLLENMKFDIILANINRNILLNDIKIYANCLPKGGTLIMSGFYETDIPAIEKECNKNGLKLQHYNIKNSWVATSFTK